MANWDCLLMIEHGEFVGCYSRSRVADKPVTRYEDRGYNCGEWSVRVFKVDGVELIRATYDGDQDSLSFFFPMRDGILALGWFFLLDQPRGTACLMDDTMISDEDGERYLFRSLAKLGVNSFRNSADIGTEYEFKWTPNNYTILISDACVTWQIENEQISYRVSKAAGIVVTAQYMYNGTFHSNKVTLFTNERYPIDALLACMEQWGISNLAELPQLRYVIENTSNPHQGLPE